MKTGRPSRGQSLLEAVIAIFLLVACFLVIVNLFHSGLNYTTRLQNQQLAAMIAERQIEQMRTWSETVSGSTYNYANLASIYNGTTTTAADYGHFSISTTVTNQTLYSACSVFEQGIAASGGSPRALSQSARQVAVTVKWDNGAHQLTLQSLFTAPAFAFRGVSPISISVQGSPTFPLPHDATATFSATGYDSNGNAIPDLFFGWEIMPVDGNGTLVMSRDGRTVGVTNRVDAGAGAYYTGGSLYLQATARYHGQTAYGNSTVVTLAP